MVEDLKFTFINYVTTYIKREGIDRLLAWLENTDFYTAPASTKYHLAEPEGLLRHTINVYNRLVQLYEFVMGDMTDKIHETLAIIALFHDLCKVNFYIPEWRNVKVYNDEGQKYDEGGRFDWVTQQGYKVEEKFSFGYHGAKSMFLVERFIKLTPEEAVCIANHMGPYDRTPGDYAISDAFKQYPLAFLLHTADSMATFIDEVDAK